MTLELTILEGSVSIHRFSCDSHIPLSVYRSAFLNISRTPDELSIVCDSSIPLESEKTESGYDVIKVIGPLDFSLTGILAEISRPLAIAKIPIFAISTFDTDYILIKSELSLNARTVLKQARYRFS